MDQSRKQARILVVANQAHERAVIGQLLSRSGYLVQEAGSRVETLRMLKDEAFAVMVCGDWDPGTNGTELVKGALRIDSDLAIVVMSDRDDATAVAEVLSCGAYDYVLKPSTNRMVETAVERALERRQREVERRRVERTVRETVILRTVQVEKEKASLRNLSLQIVHSLVRVLEAKDDYLRGHSERVASLSGRIAEELRLSFEQVEQIRLAGQLHDVGMVGIPEGLVRKPGSLSADEFELIKSHVDIGVGILSPISFVGDALTYVRDHHEHYDGGGYPRGLSGTAITLGGRIIAAADAYDALTSARSFRTAYASFEALEILSGKSGQLLDPDVCAALVRIAGNRRSFTLL